MKKIFLTATTDLNYDQRMIRICGSLAIAGYHVRLIGRQLPNSLPLASRAYEQHRLRCWFHRGKLFYLEYTLRLFWYLRAQTFDALCSVDLDSLMAGCLLSRSRPIPLIYDAHEYFSELPEVVQRPLVKKIWEWVASLCIPKASAAYTVGPGLANILSQRYGQAFSLIRNLPKRQPPPGTSELSQRFRKKILLYQGALNEGRGLEAMLSAMQQLTDVQLWLAGEGDLSARLRAMSAEMGLEKRVQFFGYLPPDQLSQMTRQATLGLNLLENKGLNYYYSLANKCFDYIQAALPALHMRFPEYEQLNEQYHIALLLDNLETETIVQATEKLLSDEKLYMQLANNCVQAAGELVWEKEEEKLIGIYQRLIGE